jgi:hypothetical protein
MIFFVFFPCPSLSSFVRCLFILRVWGGSGFRKTYRAFCVKTVRHDSTTVQLSTVCMGGTFSKQQPRYNSRHHASSLFYFSLPACDGVVGCLRVCHGVTRCY